MKVIFFVSILTLPTISSYAQILMKCELHNIATDQTLAAKTGVLDQSAQTQFEIEGLGVWAAVVDRPFDKGEREHFVVANNLDGTQETTTVRYNVSSITGSQKPVAMPAIYIEAPKLGDTIRFQCVLENTASHQ